MHWVRIEMKITQACDTNHRESFDILETFVLFIRLNAWALRVNTYLVWLTTIHHEINKDVIEIF